MKTKLVAYLNFDGNCAEAIKFYHSILGGELYVQTFGEAFADTPAEHKGRIMHASIKNEDIHLMASDTSPEYGPPYLAGNNVNLSLVGSDQATLSAYFNKLADGGTITMPLEKQFWGDIFGMLTDRFGIHWMVNVLSNPQ